MRHELYPHNRVVPERPLDDEVERIGDDALLARRSAGVNSNLLSDEDLVDPVSGNAVLNGIPVEVAPALISNSTPVY